MKHKYSLALLLMPIAIACCTRSSEITVLSPTASARIIGGTDVSNSDPIAHSTVLLIKAKVNPDSTMEPSETCSGVLISNQIVLTAAHCVTDARSKRPMPEGQIIFIYFKNSATMEEFDTDIQQGYSGASLVRYAGMAQVIADPTFSGSDSEGTPPNQPINDLGLIKLNESPPAGYVPMQLMTDPTQLVAGLPVIAAGYGPTEEDNNRDAFVLRTVAMKIQNLDPNWKQIRLQNVYDHGLIPGDSGGPVFVKQGDQLQVWGINSQGEAHGLDSSIEIIGNHVDFIKSGAKSLSSPSPL